MKKRFLLMAMAGVALAGCVSEDVAEVKQKDEKVKIMFDSPVMHNNSESRANVYGEIGGHTITGSTTIYTYPKEEDFVIYAVNHTGDFAGWSAATLYEFNGDAIQYDQSVDGWAPKNSEGDYYYWPNGKMSFAASSPADLELTNATRTYGATGLTIDNFEIQSDPSKQYDLLFSTRTVNKTSSDMLHGASYYSGIPIQFQHALSSIRFSIKNETDASVVLKEIKVYGLKYKGKFAENITENSSDYTQYERGSNVNPEWILADDVIAEGNGYVGFVGSVNFPVEAQYVASLAASDTDEAGENEQSNQLILMPQELSDGACVKVTYTVNGHEHNKVAVFRDWKDLKGQDVHEWLMGFRYTYRLVYSSSTADKDKIYFAPSTDAWIEHDVIVITL